LYAGISNYKPEQTQRAAQILNQLGTPCLIHQPVYNMFNRWIEPQLIDVLADEGIGCIVFSPLAQGMLTNRYLGGLPNDSRAVRSGVFLKPEQLTEERLDKIRRLNQIALARGQSLAQMAIAWVLRHPGITSALIGASRPQQIEDCASAVNNLAFSTDELTEIETVLA
jgi:L-glyceraldehyde 3-phosphate reductase